MIKPLVSTVKIKKVSHENALETDDLLACEEPLEIRIGYGRADNRKQKSISVTMRTPGNDFELSLGFLFTEGIIKSFADVLSIKYCTEANTIENKENIVRIELAETITIEFAKIERNFYTTSSCGICGKSSIDAIKTNCTISNTDLFFSVHKNIIVSLPDKLRAKQNVFEYTGGLHACALFDETGSLILLREDVGRHNALDKLIGSVLLSQKINFENKILLLSGRASFELIQKAVMAGMKIVCAVGAPSSLAVDTAKEFNTTLVGFLRENRFNIYSGFERIIS